MPDTPSSDDQFADLFGKLPAPQRGVPPRPDGETPSARPAQQPLSRRAAREAARGDAEAAAADSAPAGLDAAVPAAPVPAADHEATRPPSDGPAQSGARAATPEPHRAPATIDALFGADATADDHVHDKRHARDRRKGRIAGWVILGIVLLLVGGVAAGGYYVWTTYEDKIRAFMGWEEPKDFEAGQANGEAVVTIVEGDTGSSISQTLYEAGVTKTSGAFYDYLISNAVATEFYPGAYRLQKQMTSAAALEALEDPANKMENTAQLREGLTVEQSLPILADGTGIPLKDLQKAVAKPADYGVTADSLEGWLFPATYTFGPEATAKDVIKTLVDRTITSLDGAEVPKDRREEILTIASIIQREARFEDDFFKVSRVIQNRLDGSNQETHGLLQMDSTAQYGYGEMHDGSASTSAEAQYDDNPWNTYVRKGLPVGPIANPGDLAIDAAMHPADGPWLYFVTVNLDTGETVFTDTYQEHQKYVKQWQSWCAENPDSGC
ncbi:endolytic transglycosylase MltG [Microbacterium sp.]|uniref:endolytic transglycosylase MltG n=1 Tax=Microbacterium sp. TaxID=51671 RepID=UPI0039E68ED7